MKPIAIIGMSAIFPQAEDLTRYWDNILEEVDCISEVPASRWEINDYYDPNPEAPDKTYCKRGGFIPDVDFDLASIDFGSWTISLSEYQKNQVAWGFVGANAKSDPAFSSSFDPKEPSITIPFQIKNIKYGNPKCGGIRNFPCNLWVGMQGMIGKFSAMLTTIKLEAYFKDGNKMGGSCSLPGWDDRGSAYSETCKWIAFSVNIHTNNNWTNIGSGKK